MTTAIAEYQIKIPTKATAGEFFVFFVGNRISKELKSREPFLNQGGILRTNFLTLEPHRGFIRRCEVTQLRPQMQSEAATNVKPSQREHFIKTYSILENGREIVCGTRKGEEGGRVWDGLYRKQFFPVDEIDRLCAPKNDQPTGIVRLPCQNVQEAAQAQVFLFPNWMDILSGQAVILEKTYDLKKYFAERYKQANNDFERDVASAAIKSCDDFLIWCNWKANDANAKLSQAQAKGWAWTAGPEAEIAFEQTGISRRDNVQQQQAQQMDKMTEALNILAQTAVRQNEGGFQAPQPPPPPVQNAPDIDPTEWERYLRFKQMEEQQAKMKVDAESPFKPETILDAELETENRCKGFTKAGTPCKGSPSPNGYCGLHQAQAKAEV